MTNEELNTALYKKMFAEQKDYKDWLLSQPTEVILRNAYEYVMREDILLSLEYNDLSDRYATVLLNMAKPLAAIFSKLEHSDSPHMEHVWECVRQCAYDAVEAEKVKDLPVYPHSAAYARDHGELADYRASYQANVDCSKAIDAAIREHYSDNRLDPAAVSQVVERFGMERTLLVLSATARYKEWDKRIGDDHKAWAQTIPVPDDKDVRGTDRTTSYVVGYAHPGLVNLFMNEARRQAREQQPSIRQQLQHKPETPAKKPPTHKEPER